MARFNASWLVLLALLVVKASSRTLLQGGPGGACSSVFDLVSSNPELSTSTSIIEAAGLKETLSDPKLQATVFAPSNKAWVRLASDTGTTLEALLAAPADLLKSWLEYHILPAPGVEAAQLKTGSKLNTLNGEPVLVEGQKIEQAPKYKLCGFLDIHLESNFIDEDHEPLICDIKACNALVHIIDYPLVPNNSQVRALLPEGKFKTEPSC